MRIILAQPIATVNFFFFPELLKWDHTDKKLSGLMDSGQTLAVINTDALEGLVPIKESVGLHTFIKYIPLVRLVA